MLLNGEMLYLLIIWFGLDMILNIFFFYFVYCGILWLRIMFFFKEYIFIMICFFDVFLIIICF